MLGELMVQFVDKKVTGDSSPVRLGRCVLGDMEYVKIEMRYEPPDGLDWDEAQSFGFQNRIHRGVPKDRPANKCEFAHAAEHSPTSVTPT